MKKIIFVLLLVIPFMMMCQKKTAPKKVEFKEEKAIFARKSNLTFSKRLKNYPFNKAAEIKLVSFTETRRQNDDTLYYNPIMPKKRNYVICTFPFKEIKSINYLQTDSLTDILFNYGYIKKAGWGEETKCYVPRNGILFLNEKGKVFEFIEICFACKKLAYSYHDKSDAEDFERPKFKLLRDFFIKNNIEYGITKMFDGQKMGNWDDD